MTIANSAMMKDAQGSATSRVFPGSVAGSIHQVDMPKPADLRFMDWTERQIVMPRRTVRLVHWLFTKVVRRPWEMVHEFLAVAFSPTVGAEVFAERQEICNVCDEADRGHCLACRCPRWPLARLEFKNTRARHRCPKRKHPGTYPKGECKNCGGGKRHG